MESIVKSLVCGRTNVCGRMCLHDTVRYTTIHNGVLRADYKDKNPWVFTDGVPNMTTCTSLIEVKYLRQTTRSRRHCSEVSNFAAKLRFSCLIAHLAAVTGLTVASPEIVIVPGAW